MVPVKKRTSSTAQADVVAPRPTRAEKAARTRERMLAAAYDELCERGFRATTMDAIAQRAGVAVQTLYFTFHTKDGLLQELLDRAVLGPDPTPPPLQAWYQEAMAEPDVARAMALIVRGTGGILQRVAPLVPVFHAVAEEPAGKVFRRGEELRRSDFAGPMIEALLRKADLRAGVTRRQAADLLFVILSAETYHSFVLGCGWSPKEFERWATRTLTRDLFGVEAATRSQGTSSRRARPGRP